MKFTFLIVAAIVGIITLVALDSQSARIYWIATCDAASLDAFSYSWDLCNEQTYFSHRCKQIEPYFDWKDPPLSVMHSDYGCRLPFNDQASYWVRPCQNNDAEFNSTNALVWKSNMVYRLDCLEARASVICTCKYPWDVESCP